MFRSSEVLNNVFSFSAVQPTGQVEQMSEILNIRFYYFMVNSVRH